MLFFWLFLACAHKNIAPRNASPVPTGNYNTKDMELSDLTLNLQTYGVKRYTYPISPDHTAGSPYGYRIHPIYHTKKMHKGQDIPCAVGTPIRAVAKGTVITSRRSDTAGKYIEILHKSDDHEVITRYLHLKRRHFRVGKEVIAGQIIGTCGNTGASTGPHLHFEIKVDGTQVPPFLPKDTKTTKTHSLTDKHIDTEIDDALDMID